MGAIMGRANQGVRRSGSNAGGRDMSIQNIGIGQKINNKYKNKEKGGRGSGRVQFLIVKNVSVISYSDIAGGKWRTGQEESNEYVFLACIKLLSVISLL